LPAVDISATLSGWGLNWFQVYSYSTQATKTAQAISLFNSSGGTATWPSAPSSGSPTIRQAIYADTGLMVRWMLANPTISMDSSWRTEPSTPRILQRYNP